MFWAEWLDVAREALTGVPNAALRTTKSSYRWTIATTNGDLKVDPTRSTVAGGRGTFAAVGLHHVDLHSAYAAHDSHMMWLPQRSLGGRLTCGARTRTAVTSCRRSKGM